MSWSSGRDAFKHPVVLPKTRNVELLRRYKCLDQLVCWNTSLKVARVGVGEKISLEFGLFFFLQQDEP